MPQELHVLQCYQCNTYQADIVKKIPKWNCKLCGEKQSVKKVFYIGSGKECRLAVQELNKRQFEGNDVDIETLESNQELNINSESNHSNELNKNNSSNKWGCYVPQEIECVNENESNFTFVRPEKVKKRKIKDDAGCSKIRKIVSKFNQNLGNKWSEFVPNDCDDELESIDQIVLANFTNVDGLLVERNKDSLRKNQDANKAVTVSTNIFADENIDLDDVLNL